MATSRDFAATNGFIDDHLSVVQRIVTRQLVADEVIARRIKTEMTPPSFTVAGSIENDIATFNATQGVRDSRGGSLTADGVLNLVSQAGQIQIGGLPVLRQDNPASSIAVGSQAGLGTKPNLQNAALGVFALQNNTEGAGDVAVGVRALQFNTTGTVNTAVGADALGSNTTGSANSAFGNNALLLNTTGLSNVAIGESALQANLASNDNTAVGRAALFNNVANGNTAVGRRAMFNNTTGSQNTAVGLLSLFAMTTGQSNTAVGFSAGSAVNTLSRNTLLGAAANTNGGENTLAGFASSVPGGIRNVVIGAQARTTAATHNNCIVLGFGAASTATNQLVIAGPVPVAGPKVASTFLPILINNVPFFIQLYT